MAYKYLKSKLSPDIVNYVIMPYIGEDKFYDLKRRREMVVTEIQIAFIITNRKIKSILESPWPAFGIAFNGSQQKIDLLLLNLLFQHNRDIETKIMNKYSNDSLCSAGQLL